MKRLYKYYYIYLIVNKITGKKYIGQHRSNILDNDYMSSSKTLLKDIELIGRHNFEKHIIEVFGNDLLIDQLEAYYIGKYNTYEDGYNNSRTGSFDRNSIIHFPANKYICPVCKKEGTSDKFKSTHFDNCIKSAKITDRRHNWQQFASKRNIKH